MPLNEFYQLTWKQEYGGEPIANVFFYRRTTAEGGAQALTNAFEETIVPLINAWQADNALNRLIETINLGDFTDFDSVNVAGTGVNTAAALPVFNAANMTLRLNTRAVRPGSKRFSGIGESDVAEDGTIGGGTLTALNLLRAALAVPLEDDATDAIFDPVVIGRVFVPATVDHKAYYRLPETDAELTANGFGVVTTVLLSSKISHQVSRGNGR